MWLSAGIQVSRPWLTQLMQQALGLAPPAGVVLLTDGYAAYQQYAINLVNCIAFVAIPPLTQ